MNLFGGGPAEILLILLLALVVLGPERLPEVARQLGHATAELRRLAAQVTGELQDALQQDLEARTRERPSNPAPGRVCSRCQAPTAVDARFCTACGAPLGPPPQEQPPAPR